MEEKPSREELDGVKAAALLAAKTAEHHSDLFAEAIGNRSNEDKWLATVMLSEYLNEWIRGCDRPDAIEPMRELARSMIRPAKKGG